MAQDILDELLQTEKDAAELIAQAQKTAVRITKESEQKIQQIQNEWRAELKQKRQIFRNDLETAFAKEATHAQKKTESNLAKIKVSKTDLSAAADYLVKKVLA